jgi:alanine dehydrogenase
MIIGVPKERKTLEKRVGLTPDGVKELNKRGHHVLIESKAGQGSGFDDAQYHSAGAQVVSSLAEVWQQAELIVKVKEPHEEEYPFFRPNLVLFDYLHLASMPALAGEMLKSGISSIAYELVRTGTAPELRLPLLEPMSEVAGKLSVVVGANLLLSQNGGRGILLGGTLGIAPGRVVIIGAGISGRAACEMAVGLGAEVTVFDIDVRKLEFLKQRFGSHVRLLYSSQTSIEHALERADLLVGAVLVPGARAPCVLTRSMLKHMPAGSVFVDISIDQGGCAETSRATNLDHPTYSEEGVIHYGVCNMPAQTPLTSTLALTAATLPYVCMIADGGIVGGLPRVLTENQALAQALSTFKGKLTNKASAEALGLAYTPWESA